MDFSQLTIKEAHQKIKAGELKIKDLVDYFLENAKKFNQEYNVYLSFFEDIEEQIKKAEEKFQKGEADLLTGIPFAIKANILIKGKEANAASKILEGYKATYDAKVIEKLKEKGVIFLGYVNMDEFAAGGSTENSAFGVTKNAIDKERVAGGSSGGSAVAVAKKMAMVSLGTDTGGSIRQPASYNNIFGFKGSYGSVSRFGAIAMGSSLDQIGPLANNPEDLRIVFEAIKGKDEKDMTSFEVEEEIKEIKKIGIVPKVLENLNPEVKEVFFEEVEKLKNKGYLVVELDFEELNLALPVYYTLMPAELSSNLARYDGLRYGKKVEGKDMVDTYFKTRALFGPEVKRRILLGTYVLSAGYADQYYVKALKLREELKRKFKEKMKEVDLILLPTTPNIPPKIGEKTSPLEEYLVDVYTVTANILGVPAVSVPSENKVGDFKIGLQFLGEFGKDLSLLNFVEKEYN